MYVGSKQPVMVIEAYKESCIMNEWYKFEILDSKHVAISYAQPIGHVVYHQRPAGHFYFSSRASILKTQY